MGKFYCICYCCSHIGTGSLEKTLLIGDFLFVSKFHYGARTPMTTVAAPMVHDTLPIIKTKSYLTKPQLPYFRLPGFQKIKRNDIVVFSWPTDTVRQFFVKEKGVRKPIDKKSNYVKRCVGIPGDSLSIKNGYVHINGKQTILPERARPQYTHTVYAKKGVSSKLLTEVGITDFDRKYIAKSLNQEQANALSKYAYVISPSSPHQIITPSKGIPIKIIKKYRLALQEVIDKQRSVVLTEKAAGILAKNTVIDSVIKKLQKKGNLDSGIFPHANQFPWNADNFGSIYIPEAGKTVALNLEVLPLYKKIIKEYEKNTVSVNGNQISINGKATDSYTFKQDYYWMMGDNRHRSEDSRFWGYVPADHIVGKPVFIWMSFDGINDGIFNWRPRWNRIFTTVHGDGETTSYFKYFLLLLGAWFAFDFFRKKKMKKE